MYAFVYYIVHTKISIRIIVYLYVHKKSSMCVCIMFDMSAKMSFTAATSGILYVVHCIGKSLFEVVSRNSPCRIGVEENHHLQAVRQLFKVLWWFIPGAKQCMQFPTASNRDTYINLKYTHLNIFELKYAQVDVDIHQTVSWVICCISLIRNKAPLGDDVNLKSRPSGCLQSH